MHKIRIAIMADEFDRRPERTLFFRHIIEACIARSDMDVTLIHTKAMPSEPIYQRVREVVIPQLKLPWGSHFASYLRYCLTTKDRFDIVHSFTARLYPFFWLFPAKHRVVMAHGGGERLAPGKWTLPRFVFVTMLIFFQKHIDAMIAVSEYANKEIIHAFFVPPEKVVTIYPHLDNTYQHLPSEEMVRAMLKKHGLTWKNYFVYIGRSRIHKNVGNLVEAYLRYREQHPTATEHLAIGGDDRDEYERTFGALRPSPFQQDIHFIGYVENDDMPLFYRGATALAFVSLNEGFGVPIIEAMACDTPVITSSATAMPEVAGDAALIVDPYDPDALAHAFVLISTDHALREELVRRGRIRSSYFTWDKVLEKTFSLFNGLVSNKQKVINPVRATL